MMGDTMPLFTQGHALVIGVGRYSDPTWDVPVAEADARAIHATLTDAQISAYPPGQAEPLNDGQVTRARALQALRRLADRAGPDDTVLISWTGHGALGDNGLYHLATQETRFTPDQRIAAGTGLSVAELGLALREVRARKLLLVINACFSGHLGGALARGGIAPTGSVIPDDEGNTLLMSGEGRAIITASKPDQLSHFLRDSERTPFGQALIDALRGGDGAGLPSGVIGLFELYEGVYRRVRDVVQRTFGERQEPVLTLLQSAGPFAVARYPGSTEPGTGEISRRAPADLAMRQVTINITQTTDNRKLIDFGNATIRGGVQIGDVAMGDINKVVINEAPAAEADPLAKRLRELEKAQERIATLRDLDESLRDDVVSALDRARKALERGDNPRASRLIAEAADLLIGSGHPTAASIARKIQI